MIDERFTIIGLWIVVMLITAVVVGLLAFVMGHDPMHDEDYSLIIALIIFVMLFEMFLCTIYVTFKNNPEQYGYTRIETEVTDE